MVDLFASITRKYLFALEVNLPRIVKLTLQSRNATPRELWQSRSDDGMDDDEIVGDDLLTPGADARKLYENLDQLERGNGNKNKGGGSWLLRTGFGRNGGSLGEKLGETIEIAAYKGMNPCLFVTTHLPHRLSYLSTFYLSFFHKGYALL